MKNILSLGRVGRMGPQKQKESSPGEDLDSLNFPVMIQSGLRAFYLFFSLEWDWETGSLDYPSLVMTSGSVRMVEELSNDEQIPRKLIILHKTSCLSRSLYLVGFRIRHWHLSYGTRPMSLAAHIAEIIDGRVYSKPWCVLRPLPLHSASIYKKYINQRFF